MEITAVAEQTVEAGRNVLFTDDIVSPGCGCSSSIVHRQGSGLITLRGITSGQCRARFKVYFGGNLCIPADGTAPGEISVSIALNGEPVGSTTAIVTPPVVNRYFNVASAVYVDVPKGCCVTVSVQNTSNQDILVQNANLIAERVA